MEDYIKGAASDNPVILFNPNASIISSPDSENFEHLKQLLSTNAPVLWLTTGVNQGVNPPAPPVAGLLRVVREENKASEASVLDYDTNTPLKTVAQAIVSITSTEKRALPAESEFWLHGDTIHVSRVITNDKLNTRMLGSRGIEKFEQRTLTRGDFLEGIPKSGTVSFYQNNQLQKSQLGDDEVDIQVEALETQKKDMKSAPSTPRLVYGKILHVGSNAQSSLVGQPVIAYTTSAYDTIVRVPAAAAIEISSMSGDAAKLLYPLPALIQALSALRASSKAIEQKTVVLASSSTTLTKSMKALRRSLQFQLVILNDDTNDEASDEYTSLRSNDFENIQRVTKQAGPATVVIVENFASSSQRLWLDLPAGASFVLSSSSSSYDLATSPGIAPFKRGARFIVSNVESDLATDPETVSANLRTAITVAQQDKEHIGKPIFTLKEIAESTDTVPETSVLALNYENDLVSVAPSEFSLRFSSEDAYLLVGCLGGLGRSLTTWMVECGAKHLVFISRSGADKPAAAKLIEDIKAAGALPAVFRGDATKASDIRRAIDVTMKGDGARKIRGVVHAAMVLNDVMFHNMSVDTWNDTLSPKVKGALALDEALASEGIDADLDFFVMTSSISATAGPPGQTTTQLQIRSWIILPGAATTPESLQHPWPCP